jgi:hypothetical protein
MYCARVDVNKCDAALLNKDSRLYRTHPGH